MYAIVDIAGQQIKVEKNQQVLVHRLEGETGTSVVFDNVLLLDNDGKIAVGKPKVEGAGVSATIIEHVKGDKVLVFHKNRRKGYQKLNGHRQALSKIIIQDIAEDKTKLNTQAIALPTVEKTIKAPAKVKKVAEKKVVAEKKEPVAKKAAPKKAAVKKVAAKKTTTKKSE